MTVRLTAFLVAGLLLATMVSGVSVEPTVRPAELSSNRSPYTGRLEPTAGGPPAPIRRIVPVGSDLADLVVDPARPRAYVADRLRNQVHVIDLNTGSVTKSVTVRVDPVALAINPSSTRLYVGHGADRGIVVIDLSTQDAAGVLNTTFDVWDITVPMDDTLLVSSRSSPAYVYSLNATDGSIRERLCWGFFCNAFSYDSYVAVAPDRWLYVVESANTLPLRVHSFRPQGGSWSWETYLHDGGGVARDVAVSVDSRFVYVANRDSSVEIFEGHSVASLGRFGPFTTSMSVETAPVGSRVALSVGGAEIHIFEADRTYRGNVTASAAVESVRATPDRSRFVAVVGGAIQDVEILSAAQPQPISPVGLVGLPRTPVRARGVALIPDPAGTATLEVDGAGIPTSYDPGTGSIVGTPNTDLSEGVHTAKASLRNFGVNQSSNWSFDVDSTPPVIQLDPVPTKTDEPAIVVGGNASDRHLAFVSINGRQASLAPNGRFSLMVSLVQGPNVLEVVAQDTVGNVLRLVRSVVFEPILMWFFHPASHFRIQVPHGWNAEGNATLGGETADVLMTSPGSANIIVASEARPVEGTYASARAILQEVLDNLSRAFPGFSLIEGPSERSVDEHAAAAAFVVVQPSTFNVYQLIVIVVGPEWGRAWAIAGTLVEGQVNQRPLIESTIASFDVLPAGEFPSAFGEPLIWILRGVAVTAAALVVAYFVIAARRRPPVQPPRPPPPPPPAPPM